MKKGIIKDPGGVKSIIKGYYRQLYPNKILNVDKDLFF